jgi:hypothetical protein
VAGWLTLIKLVPWNDVISAAPDIARTARKFLGSVRNQAGDAHVPANGPDDSVAGVRRRLSALETEAVSLREQMLALSQLIKDLAEQNTQLVARLESHRKRLLGLVFAVMVLGVLTVLLLAMFASA